MAELFSLSSWIFCRPTNFKFASIATKAIADVKEFSCWDQFLCLAFAQLTYRESLRDIEACLRSQRAKLYHMGFRGLISRNTPAHANLKRNWRIFADFARVLIAQARPLYRDEPFAVELDQTIYALDSTTIDLCLSLEFRLQSESSAVTVLEACSGGLQF